MEPLEAAGRLAAALAAGLMIGLERGWRERERPDGARVAGLRTFTLIGLLGGVLGLLPGPAWPLAAGLAAVALLFAVAFRPSASASGSFSITTAVAGLVTLGLGALAAQGQMLAALGTATVVALLLGLKRELHAGIRRLDARELTALLQLAVLTGAVLPLLPDAGYGPYQALNPFRLWLAVIVIAALSLLGHAASHWRGPEQGLLWAGLLGGLASSTAATLALARAARAQPALAVAAAAGSVAACGMMFLRMAAVVSVLQPALALPLGGALAVLGTACFAAAAWQWRGTATAGGTGAHVALPAASGAVFDLPTALAFGLLLGVVAVAVRAAQQWLGDAGIYGVSFLSGLADVDAILVSTIGLQAQGALGLQVARHALALAVLANMVSKAAMAWFVGGRVVGTRVLAGYGAVAAVALLGLAAQEVFG